MIIGNNNYNPNNNNFKSKMNVIKNNSIMKPSHNMQTKQYKDVNNSNEMIEESLKLLQERFNQGLIAYDDFIKQCNKLNKLRK